MKTERLGLVQVYTGEGKGKTTASLGLALRALGHDLKVCVIQFMKGGAYTGEFIVAKNLLQNLTIMQFGRGCIKEHKQLKLSNKNFDFIRDDVECGPCRYCFLNDEEQKKFVSSAFEKSKEVSKSGEYNVVILDEINMAVHLNLISIGEVLDLIKNKYLKTELILTGRNAHEKILEIADLITEMKLHKHYFSKGISARKGIEY